MSRIFIALTPDNIFNSEIISLKQSLKKELVKEAQVTWANDKHHHITINFNGHMEPEQIEEMYLKFEEIEVIGSILNLEITGTNYFPNENGQVIVANVNSSSQLQKLQQQVQTLVAQIGFDTQLKSFRPHITLGRFKEKNRPIRELKSLEEPLKATFNSLDVYESTSTKGKVNHKLIKEFKF